MPQNSNTKFKTVKRIVKSGNSSDSQSFYGIHLITSSKAYNANENRLLSPIEAEMLRSKLLAGHHDGDSSIRKLRKPTRNLSLKPAPVIPTAPKSALEIRKKFIFSQLKSHFQKIDFQLVFLVLLLSLIGIMAVYSSTLTYNSSRFIVIQAFSVITGFAIMIALSFFDYRQFAKQYRMVILLNAVILLLTFIFGEGVTDNTNVNWINLGFIKIQPSEFAKILFIYSFSVHLYYVKDRINKIFTALTLFLHGALIIGLTLLQKDLGTLTIFIFIFAVMCFSANLNIWYYITAVAATALLSPFIWSRLNYYQQQRILVPFDATVDPNGIGVRQQTLKSMTAISLGGIGGSGYGNGELTQGNFFAKHTDMIFSTICEEFGFVGGITVIILYILLIVKIVKVALSCENPLGTFICTGVAAMLVIQIIENIGMCLGIMPVIGITLPFISYGGSSAFSVYIALGLVFSVCTHKEKVFFM
jgi:rod shape determining protein RodA